MLRTLFQKVLIGRRLWAGSPDSVEASRAEAGPLSNNNLAILNKGEPSHVFYKR